MGETMETPERRKAVTRGVRRWYGNAASEQLSDYQWEQFERDAMGMGPELLGVCKECGEVQSPVEPDATGNPCSACDVKAVMGFSEVALRGFFG